MANQTVAMNGMNNHPFVVVQPGEDGFNLFKCDIWQASPSQNVKNYLRNNSIAVKILEGQDATGYGNNAIQMMLLEKIKDMNRDQKMFIVFVRENHVSPMAIIDIFGKYNDGFITFEALNLADVQICVLHINDEGIWHAIKNNHVHEDTFKPSAANAYHVICTMNELLDQCGDMAMTEQMLKDEWDTNHTGFVMVYDNHPRRKKVVNVTKLDGTFPTFVRAMFPDLPWSSASQDFSQNVMPNQANNENYNNNQN